MQITSEKINPCKIDLTIEIEPEKVAEAYNQAYKEFGKVTSVPGFRKGKAPRAILEKYVAEESVRREVADILVTQAYPAAIEQEKIEPYADPEFNVEELEEGKPAKFKASVPLPPKVELGEYKGIKVTKTKVEATDADVDLEVKNIQDRRTTAEKVEDRGVQETDIVIAEISSNVDDGPMCEPKRSLIQIGQNVPGFDEQIMGLKPGERKSFELTYPDDFEDEALRGKKSKFDVSVESLRERKAPELNDEFAKEVGGFENMDALRAHIKQQIIEFRENESERDVERQIVEGIVANSEIHLPEVLVEHEIGHDMQEIQASLNRQNLTIDQYLRNVGKDREEFFKELYESAERRLKAGMAMGEVSDKENIDVKDEDIDAEIERLAAESNTTTDAIIAYMDSRGGRATLGNNMLNRRILDYLKSVSVVK